MRTRITPWIALPLRLWFRFDKIRLPRMRNLHTSFVTFCLLLVAGGAMGFAPRPTFSSDPFGNRVRTTVGNAVTRFVYQDGDVVAEYDDYNNDGVVDHKR
ncbi:MAG: hypothetical protein H7831_18690, partial [Magnetococcus sp. WYHC-3]